MDSGLMEIEHSRLCVTKRYVEGLAALPTVTGKSRAGQLQILGPIALAGAAGSEHAEQPGYERASRVYILGVL
jgi:hypothetical protein